MTDFLQMPKMGDILEKISKTNAMYPLLAALLFVVALASGALWLTDNTLVLVFAFSLVGIVVFQIVRSFQYLSLNNPSMLRSEEHIIRQRVIDFLGDDQNGLQPTAADVISIVNPETPKDVMAEIVGPPIEETKGQTL